MCVYIYPLTIAVFLINIAPLLMAMDYEYPEVVANLRNPHRKYYCISRIMGQQGADIQMSSTFIKVVVQVIIVFGLDILVVITHLGETLGGLHNMVALQMTKKLPCMHPKSS